MKICLAGEGAMGLNHMKVLSRLEEVEVVTLAGGIPADAQEFAKTWNIPHWSTDLTTCLRQPGVEAVILTTPSQIHTQQTLLALGMGKHVLVEIPMGLSRADSERVVELADKTGLACMVCHSRRFSPPHLELYRRMRARTFHLHHLITQTYFMRRTNLNMFGKPRTWRDDLLWHHACHSVDQAFWLLDDPEMEVWGQRGPDHPGLGIPMDMTVGLKSRGGTIVTMALSFNNKGPIASVSRYIGEEERYDVVGDTMTDSQGRDVVLRGSSYENQDREFFAAIREGRQPQSSVKACLPTMLMLDRIERCF